MLPASLLSGHMAQHIAMMNLVAPLLVLLWRRRLPPALAGSLLPATVTQLTLLWGWHSPPVLPVAMHAPLLQPLMHASLAAAAIWFWAAVVAGPASGRWRPILALLVTSKLFCLLGVLLVFAPRSLYAFPAALRHEATVAAGLADQQLAGLLMLVACPATYLVAAVVLATQALIGLDRASGGRRAAPEPRGA